MEPEPVKPHFNVVFQDEESTPSQSWTSLRPKRNAWNPSVHAINSGDSANDLGPLMAKSHNLDVPEEDLFVNAGRLQTVSASLTLANLIKCYLGSGLLGLPFAFHQGGFLASFVVMLTVGVMTTHTMNILVNCKRKINAYDASVVTFEDIAYHTLGKWGKKAVVSLLLFTQFGFTCVYIVFLGTTLDGLIEDYTSLQLDWRLIVLCWIPLLCLLANIQTLKSLGPLAIFANVCILGSIIIFMVACLVNFSNKVHHHEKLEMEWYANWESLPIMLSVSIYAFEGIGVIIPAETAMKEPEKFGSVLTTTMIVSVLNYTVFGLVGYLGFGSDIKSVITINLTTFARGSVGWDTMNLFVTISLMIAILITYPLQLFVVTDICEEAMFKEGRLSVKNKWAKQIVFRCGLVFMGAGVAIGIPNFGLLISLIGSLGTTSLQFVFPGLFYLVLNPHASRWLRLLALFYVCFGISSGILGTVQTVRELIDQY
eukprot:TRINITY_DN5506_c0_g1_i1.p1 TRINITY_DN5506_c0_g1~~TRINITY_DN5506_c0_g1_i1.p1  ORF type:complete len:483 (+),score=49.10 TRINITY_DN5506_c0_g1_i1:26-1474(+)